LEFEQSIRQRVYRKKLSLRAKPLLCQHHRLFLPSLLHRRQTQ